VVYEGRPTTWTGKVALMYPSDYGYATSGGANGRTNCLSYYLYRWKSYSGCYSNDFLYYGSGHWFLTTFSTGSYGAFVMSVAGYTYHVDGDPVKYSRAIRPTIYLNSKVQIISGDGTNNSPWIIGR
jgi:hypothetical protein